MFVEIRQPPAQRRKVLFCQAIFRLAAMQLERSGGGDQDHRLRR